MQNDVAALLSDDFRLPWLAEPFNDYLGLSNWDLDPTSSIFIEDGGITMPLEGLDTSWFESSKFLDWGQLPGDNDLLGLGDIFAQSPSSTLTFTHGESEGGLWKLPLSDTLPNDFQPRSYTCNHCGKISGRPSQLRKHRKIHDENDRIHRCNKCDLSFHYQKDLKRHRRTKHQLSDELLEVYKCPVNGCQLQKKFTRKDKYKEHIQKQHAFVFSKEPCEDTAILCDSTSRSDQLCSGLLLDPFYNKKAESTSQQDASKKSHICPFKDCDRTDGFASRVDLCRHLRSVHTALLLADSNGFFRCVHEECKHSTKIYPRKDNFKRHVNAAHRHVDHTDDLIERSKFVPYNAKIVESEDSSSTTRLFIPNDEQFQKSVRLAASFHDL